MSDPMNQLRSQMDRSSAESARALERIESQLAFAASLCEFFPKQAPGWRRLIAKAEAAMLQAGGDAPARVLREAVTRAETLLRPLSSMAKSFSIHCVGHAHIDMNWMWSWPETVATCNDTFITVLRLMKKYPQFRFTQSQASVYAAMEKHHPELLREIAARVREGRWEVAASHWVECDKNLISGESMCRHLLYTRRYLSRLFGLSAEDVPVDWSPDTFGFAATVPSVLVRGGVRFLYLHRPGSHEHTRTRAFRWVAPDGSEVLVFNDSPFGYNGAMRPGIARNLVEFRRQTGLPFCMHVYGVGDHGGGPTERDIRMGLEMDSWPVFPRVEFSTARAFFGRLEREGRRLPVVRHELNTEFAGCYSSQSLVKKINRFAENRLVDSEAASVVGSVLANRPYAHAAFEEGWRETLFTQFHDVLPGSHVHDARTFAHAMYQQTVTITSMEEGKALRRLAAEVETGRPPSEEPGDRARSSMGAGVGYHTAEGGMSLADQSSGSGPRPFVVFNPTAWNRHELVEAVVWENAGRWGRRDLKRVRFSVTDASGRCLPAQVVETGRYWEHDFTKMAFPVEVPSLGYATVRVEEKAGPEVKSACRQLRAAHHCSYARRERGLEGLENSYIRMELDPTTGAITRLVDKRTKQNLVTPDRPAQVLECVVEPPHGMSSWHVDHAGPVEPMRVTGLKPVLDGPWRVSLQLTVHVRSSEFTVTYELRHDDPTLYLSVKGTWFERGGAQVGVPVLRASFPLALAGAKGTYEIPFGDIEREACSGEEVPALQWALVRGRSANGRAAGCLLLNDSKHGYSLEGSVLRLTLIRSSYEPDPLPEILQHEFQLGLRPVVGDLPAEDAARLGQAFNRALRVVSTDLHEGRLPAVSPFLTVAPSSVVVTSVKKAEDDDGAVVVRLSAPGARSVRARLSFARGRVRVRRVVETDVLERPLTRSTARVVGPSVEVKVPARGFATVKVSLETRK
jgi:alpha-mannosidase